MIAGERERWRTAQQWLVQLLELPAAQRRHALDAAGLEPGLQACVERLLQAADHPDPRLEPDTGGVQLDTPPEPRNRLAGRQVGDWELLEEIGRGGMAVVYRARRQGAGFEQIAAVKLLGLAALGSDGVHRFERERRVLAALRHPHIAALVDGGLADDGTPFLAMQLVEGSHIDEWCIDQALDLAARVRLLVQVCEAVAHAHRNLVVHRDIKPANIQVTPAGVPVLLDFGIAKLLDNDADATRTALRALTPGYAAPEQSAGGAITTATDVYALGAVLRRLTEDCMPLPADLRNVTALATRPEPERRYRDARALGEDLQRWLQQQPVSASPDSAGYRLRMWLRRRRGVAIASGAALLLLLAGVAATLWQAQRATEQARRAAASRDFLVDLFVAADPERTGREPGFADLVARGTQRVDLAFADNPALHAEMAMMLGHLAMVGGDHDRAAQLLAGALQRSRQAGEPALEAEVHYRLGLLGNRQGEPREAIVRFERALGAMPPDSPAAASLRERVLPPLTYALENTGQVERARTLARDALAAAQTQEGRPDPDLRARLLSNAGRLEQDPERQLALLQQASAWFERGSPTPYERMVLDANVATALSRADRYEEAVAYLQRATSAAEQVYSEPSSHQARLYNNLGSQLRAAGRLAEAERAQARSESLFRALGDQHSPAFAALLNNRGRLLQDLDRAAESAALLEEATTLAERHFGADDWRVGITLGGLARARAEAGDARGEADWQRAWTILQATDNAHRQVNLLATGAVVALALEQPAAALQRADQTEVLAAAAGLPDGSWRAYLALVRGGVALAQQQPERARALFEQGIAQAAALGEPAWSATWRLHRAFGDALHADGDSSAAATQYRLALALLEAHGIGTAEPAHAALRARLEALQAV